ncbi:MAG: type II toxin-antitoxin system CcdA family antitoxin [Deltaproteobacteria bacterium]|nr:type II toxin-antitoxin system CcdA family antitoxin [Deltaproteobacteria bacterium]
MKKTCISISDEIFEEAKSMSDNFSSIVSEALIEYIKKKRIENAKNSFGKWKSRAESTEEIIKKIRTDTGRNYIGSDN